MPGGGGGRMPGGGRGRMPGGGGVALVQEDGRYPLAGSSLLRRL